ncbi:MAG: glycosyltransferase family 2 protein [Elainellaceae cyanobacterium]
MTSIDILIPTYNRATALAVTLAGLCAQTVTDFNVVISDQSDHAVASTGEVQAVCRVLRAKGHGVTIHRHLPRRGIAEQRQFLLNQATTPSNGSAGGCTTLLTCGTFSRTKASRLTAPAATRCNVCPFSCK